MKAVVVDHHLVTVNLHPFGGNVFAHPQPACPARTILERDVLKADTAAFHELDHPRARMRRLVELAPLVRVRIIEPNALSVNDAMAGNRHVRTADRRDKDLVRSLGPLRDPRIDDIIVVVRTPATADHRALGEMELDPALAEQLHFRHTFCGGGPYDTVGTMEWMLGEAADKLELPVLLPLIVRGLLYGMPDYFHGRTFAALQLIEACRSAELLELGVQAVDTTKHDFLTVTLGDYSKLKILWENMDEPTPDSQKDLYRRLTQLRDIRRSKVAPGTTTTWNATMPDSITADTQEKL